MRNVTVANYFQLQVLQAIRIIKIFAWETSWEDKILVLRDIELKELRNNFIYLTMFDLLWMASPILVAIVSVSTLRDPSSVLAILML